MLNIKPTLAEIQEKLNEKTSKTIISVYAEIIADLETPVSAYDKVCKNKSYSFLLESAEGGESFGRYSFIGIDPLFILKSSEESSAIYRFLQNSSQLESVPIKTEPDPYKLLDNFLKEYSAPDFNVPFLPGAVGYFGFDTIRFIEPKLKESYKKIEKCESFPDAYFMISGNSLAFDHVKHKIYVISNIVADNSSDLENAYNNAKNQIEKIIKDLSAAHNLEQLSLTPKPENSGVSSNISRDEWEKDLDAAKEHIKSGDIFQVVLSQRFRIDKEDIDNLSIYRALRSINPSPYMYYLNFNDFTVVGSSPEALVKCSKDKTVSTRPIAGTRRRGMSPERDKEMEDELINDPKERAEHVMLVDLARNDLGRVCEYGTVKVNRFMAIERFSHVMHIVSDVSGKLKEDLSSIDLLRACFPAGTVSGAPKVRAMEIIYDLEKSARGPYGGCIGYFGFDNRMNAAITLRTMLIRDNNIFIQAGGGIVADSDANLEYLESQNKAAALVQAVNALKK